MEVIEEANQAREAAVFTHDNVVSDPEAPEIKIPKPESKNKKKKLSS